MIRALTALWLIGCLGWVGYVISEVARDTAQRGRARVHGGGSWGPR